MYVLSVKNGNIIYMYMFCKHMPAEKCEEEKEMEYWPQSVNKVYQVKLVYFNHPSQGNSANY